MNNRFYALLTGKVINIFWAVDLFFPVRLFHFVQNAQIQIVRMLRRKLQKKSPGNKKAKTPLDLRFTELSEKDFPNRLQNPDCFHRGLVIVGRNLDAVPAAGCVNDGSAANVDGHMADAAAVTVEEQVSRLQCRQADFCSAS